MDGILYYHATIANAYVYEDANGALWLVPWGSVGWQRRRPYRSYRQSLREMSSVAEQRVLARTAGIPVDEP